MRIGVDYYPEHWPEERWPLDARLMREAGISLVRVAEFAWCRLEPREGSYDFGWLDRALAMLHGEGIQVVVGIPTAAPPAWLHERYPDIYPMDARRHPLGFGTRRQRCLNNPALRSSASALTAAMADHFADNPAVIGWQIDNELEANLCYCDVCAAGFRDWLRARYGALPKLNEAWGTIFWGQEYSGWSQIPLPWEARCGLSHNPSLKLDYRRFASESTVVFHDLLAAILRRLAPAHFITHNCMGLHDTLDYHRLAENLDFVSWNNYPVNYWDEDGPHQALAHDVMRGLKRRNFWIMEEQSGIAAWERMSRRPAPGQIRAWAWQAVGHGADAVIFFRWRSCLYGTEQHWQGILDHDGLPRRRYREIALFGREIGEVSPALDESAPGNQVAILNSYEQNWALQIQPQAEGLGWWEQVRRFYDSLSRLGVPADLAPIEADLETYRLIIVPSWYLLTEEAARRLTVYVQGGGTLILNPRTGVKNANNTCHPLALPGFLADLAGLEIDDYDPLGRSSSLVRLAGGEEFAVSVWADALTLRGAEVFASYSAPPFSGEPAIARREFGRGTVYYCGTFGEPAFYDTFLGRTLTALGVPGLPGLPAGIDASWRTKDGARFLFLVNEAAEEKTVRLPEDLAVLLGPAVRAGAVNLPAYGVGIYQGR